MNKHPLISIITVCYNIKDEIEQTCKSILSQTFQDYEWIVIDGGSTDGTVEILNKYKNKISIFISEKDSGIYNAMNKGIKLASGIWLNFMNGGDSFIHKNILKEVFSKQYGSADILYGKSVHKKQNHKTISSYPNKLNKQFFMHSNINHQNTFIKRELFYLYGLYDEQYKIAADWEKWIIFAKKGLHFHYLNHPIAIFDGNGISSNTSIWKDELNTIISKHYKLKKIIFKIYVLGIPILKIIQRVNKTK